MRLASNSKATVIGGKFRMAALELFAASLDPAHALPQNIAKYVKILDAIEKSPIESGTMEQRMTEDLKFYTAPEVAEILKMNPQVIARKLQGGEMEGYKIGKDWRVSHTQLMRFLDQHSNMKAPKTPQEKAVQSFFEDGKLKSIPTTRSKREMILRHLVSQLESSRVYSEKELNQFISEFHPDVCTIRREFIINKLMVRKSGKYKVATWNQQA